MVGVDEFSQLIGVTKQYVSKAARTASKPNYRGKFLAPDTWIGGRPYWITHKADEYVKSRS